VDSRCLVTSGFADLDGFVAASGAVDKGLDKIPLFESMLPSLDVWALQLYRGKTFGSYFADFLQESRKPLLVTEFGVDAFNDPCGWPENAAFPTCFNMNARSDFGGDKAQAGIVYRGCADNSSDCALQGEVAQMQWDVLLAKEIMAAASKDGKGAVAGGFVMAWLDEYWKGANVQDHCSKPCPVQDADSYGDVQFHLA